MAGEWWRGAVIYQIYPRSFADSTGDGVGDLRGIIAHLPYVAALGVDGIWLSPVFTSPMRDFGYDVADYRDIDPIFGTLADFDALLAEAHRLGLRVIIDQVYSHSSDDHPWFTASRAARTGDYAGYYVWADPKPDGGPPNNWLAVFGGGAWSWEPRRRQYYLHNFLQSQPDLNLHDPAVQAEILGVAAFWLDRGVDGFRLDVANFYMQDPALRDNPPAGNGACVKPYDMQRHMYDRSRPENLAFIARLRALLDSYSDRMAVAELATSQPVRRMAEYTQGPDRLHTAYSFVFLSGALTPARVRETLATLSAEAPEAWPSWAFENHDVPRCVSRWGAGRDAARWAKTLLALLTALRGTAFVYQGQELGLPQADVPRAALRDPEGIAFWPENKGRDGCRTPMPWQDAPGGGFTTGQPWLPVAPAHLALNAARQEGDAQSVLSFARHWLHWRRGQSVMREGALAFLPAPEPVLAFTRGSGPGALTFVFNLGLEQAAWPAEDSAALFDLGAVREGAQWRLPPSCGLVLGRVNSA